MDIGGRRSWEGGSETGGGDLRAIFSLSEIWGLQMHP